MPAAIPNSPDQPPPLIDPARRRVRNLGWLLIVLGPCLSLGIGAIAYLLYQTIVHNNDAGAHSHWNGSAEFTRTTFELFGAVFVFGLVAFVGGILQVRTGRRQPLLMVPMLLCVAAMVYFGYQIMSVVPPPR